MKTIYEDLNISGESISNDMNNLTKFILRDLVIANQISNKVDLDILAKESTIKYEYSICYNEYDLSIEFTIDRLKYVVIITHFAQVRYDLYKGKEQLIIHSNNKSTRKAFNIVDDICEKFLLTSTCEDDYSFIKKPGEFEIFSDGWDRLKLPL